MPQPELIKSYVLNFRAVQIKITKILYIYNMHLISFLRYYIKN